jgi:uncharacterized protein YprB with RNaseH-like and TPR domain
MASSDKFSRLEDLAVKLGKAKIALGSEWARKARTPGAPEKEASPKITRLEDVVAGTVRESPASPYYHITKQVTAVWPDARRIVRYYKEALADPGQKRTQEAGNEELAALTAAPASNITYLDIETCGFAGNAVFLIGWCWFNGRDDLVVEQALARDYSEEAGILHAVAERFAQTRVLVTFNGKSFDLPSIRERAVIHRVSLPEVSTHVDVLHQARAQWRHVLPNCQLQTLELFLCRRPRRGDVHGSAIPQIYHDYVKNLDAGKLKTIIHHNFLDIVTLAEITAHLVAGHQPEF